MSESPPPPPPPKSTTTSDRRRGNTKGLSNSNAPVGRQQQLSSFVLFASVILFVNLCPPFQQDLPAKYTNDQDREFSKSAPATKTPSTEETLLGATSGRLPPIACCSWWQNCLRFIRLVFTSPIKLGQRTTRYTQAEAAMLGKMAKVWYIKKKIKKLGKKLKKHTIAVPVFTAIPIYEHSYYPQQPHVAHMSQHHAAAASSYSPAYVAATVAAAAAGNPPTNVVDPQMAASGQLVASASNNHQQLAPAAFRMSSPPQPSFTMNHQHQSRAILHPFLNNRQHQHAAAAAAAAASNNQIINAYPPSPPLYVDEAGGLYGHYGNAYGRYDGGYQLW